MIELEENTPNEVMFTGTYYRIIANKETQSYDLSSIATGFVEATDKAYPKIRITLEEFERRMALWSQQKDAEDVIVAFPPR